MVGTEMNPVWSLIVDGVLALLLVGAIIACAMVYKKLQTIREGQDELKVIVDDLNTAVIEAQRSVGTLKHTAIEVEQQLQTQVGKAKAMSDELVMITEAGNNLADRIEQKLTGPQAKMARGEQTGAEHADDDMLRDVVQKPKLKTEQKELLDALKEAR